MVHHLLRWCLIRVVGEVTGRQMVKEARGVSNRALISLVHWRLI